MKVISGYLKGRNIEGYDIIGTRPTMNRLKESVFATIQDYVKDSIFLDLFAGTGNIGIEAISNGASFCYFVDNNRIAIDIIKKSVNKFDITNKCNLINKDYKNALNYFIENNITFDIIYIDPPYKMNCLDKIVNIILDNKLLKENGLIILEYNNFNNNINHNLEIIKNKKYGDKYITILKNN